MSENGSYNEKELLLKISMGDEAAFATLFNTYQPLLYSFLLNLTRNKEESEDIIHDIFLKCWLNRTALNSVQNIKAYLYGMVRNRGIDGFRKQARETLALSAFVAKPLPENDDPEALIIHKEIRQIIRSSVSQLTPQQRQVYTLSREKGLKQEEIANELGISVLTVKRHLTDALNYLRKEIIKNYPAYGAIICLLHKLGPPL